MHNKESRKKKNKPSASYEKTMLTPESKLRTAGKGMSINAAKIKSKCRTERVQKKREKHN